MLKINANIMNSYRVKNHGAWDGTWDGTWVGTTEFYHSWNRNIVPTAPNHGNL